MPSEQTQTDDPSCNRTESRCRLTRRRTVQLAGIGAAGALGMSPGVAGAEEQPEIEPLWTYDPDGGITRSSPTIADGRLFVGGRDGRVYAVDIEDGSEMWTYQTDGLIVSTPHVTAERVFVGSNDGNVYALDVEEGTVDWSFEVDTDADFGDVWSSPTVTDGVVYVGGRDTNIYALDAETGDLVWEQTDPEDWVVSSPTVADNTVYIGSGSFWNNEQATLYALDADDGSIEWTFEGGDFIASSPTVVDGTVYVGDERTLDSDTSETSVTTTSVGINPDDGSLRQTVGVLDDDPDVVGTVYAVDATTGELDWSFETDARIRSSPTVADGTLYIGDEVRQGTSNLYAIDITDGTEQWRFDVGAGIESSPTVAGDRVYVGGYDNVLYAVDTTDGSEVWSFETPDNIRASPLVVDGVLYFGGDAGHGGEEGLVYAIETEDPELSDGSRVEHGTLNHHDRDLTESSPTATDDPSPGFGPIGAVAGIGAVTYYLQSRLRKTESTDS